MPIILACRGCGAEAPSTETKAGRCRACQADQACARDRDELARLYRKRQRYAKAGASPAGCDRQAIRCRQRIWRRCQEIEPDPQRAKALSDRQADMAGKSVHGRILVPMEA